MKQVSIGKPQYFTVEVSRDELRALVAIEGHVGGGGKCRRALEGMARDARIMLEMEGSECWRDAARELDARITGSLYADEIKP